MKTLIDTDYWLQQLPFLLNTSYLGIPLCKTTIIDILFEKKKKNYTENVNIVGKTQKIWFNVDLNG